jgi:ribonuclease P protein component
MSAPQSQDVPAAGLARRPVVRLKRRGDFLRVAGARTKWVTPGFILQAAPNPAARGTPANADAATLPAPRLGFTVSRKVGKAVIRNRARRRLRAAADEVFPAVARPGWDYVLIGRRDTKDLDFARLLADMHTALDRLASGGGRGGRGGGGRRHDTRRPSS